MNKSKELKEIIQSNPERELIFMYPDETSDYSYTLGKPSKIIVDEYTSTDERVWIRYQDEDEMFHHFAENIADDFYMEGFPLSEEKVVEIENKAQEQISKIDWKRAIIVYIQPGT